jgi:hypothetical protein
MELHEKLIEAKVAAAIAAANIPASAIVGAWTTATGGGLKNVESVGTVTTLEISTGIRQYDTAQIPTADVPVSVAIATMESADPTGAAFASAAAAIAAIFQGWQDDFSAAESALSFPGFAVTSFRMDGGSAPMRDGTSWTVVISATVGGVFTTIPTTNAKG